MISETVRVRIDGEAHDDLVGDLLAVDAEEDADRAGVFAVRLATAPGPRGPWSHVDDPRLRVWRRVTVELGYGDAMHTVADGYVTHVEVALDTDVAGAYLELSGMDATAVMNLTERQVAWPDKKDHEIAAEIFESYGLSYEVEDTVVAHEAEVSTVLQVDTDIRFLRRLAARNGFECHVSGATGYFRAPDLAEPPQKTLVLSGGPDGNLVRANVGVDGTPATVIEIRGIDPIEKREVTRSLARSPRRGLGADGLAALQRGLPRSRVLLRGEVAASGTEMESRLRGAYGAADRFVRLSGEVDSRAYRSVLRAGRLVTVRGLGETHSGLYYVDRVRHAATADGYRQTFEAYRNGVGLTGREQFDPPTAPAAIRAGGDTGTRRVGNRVLPAQPSTALIRKGGPR